MLVKNTSPHQDLTVGKLYPVIGTNLEKGQMSYLLVNDQHFESEDWIRYYFVLNLYPSTLFEVVDKSTPADWVTKTTKHWFRDSDVYHTYGFLLDKSSFFARIVDGSQPETSFFFYKFKELYAQYNLGKLNPNFEAVPEDHLNGVINFPKYVTDDWVDPVDGKVYKSNN